MAIPGVALVSIPDMAPDVGAAAAIVGMAVMVVWSIPAMVPDVDPDGAVVCWLEPQAASRSESVNKPNHFQRSIGCILSCIAHVCIRAVHQRAILTLP